MFIINLYVNVESIMLQKCYYTTFNPMNWTV